MRRGEVWTVILLSHPKPRPGVIVSVDAWNAYARDVILVPLTTKSGPSRPTVRHPKLDTVSFAKCGSIGAVPKQRLGQRIGMLNAKTMDGIERELKRIMGL